MNISPQAMAHLSWWVVQEVQKHFGIVSTERLNIKPPDHRYFHVNVGSSTVRIFINGENTGSESMEVYLDFTTNSATVEVPSVHTLIKAERVYDFDMTIIDQDELEPDGSIVRTVNFTEVMERIPLWDAMPVQALNDSPNRPPNVVGGM